MKKIISINHLSEVKGGDLKSFCVGYAAGVSVGLSFGWTLGPIGYGAVILVGGVCLLGDKGGNGYKK